MESANSAMTTFPNACNATRKAIKQQATYIKTLIQSVKRREALPGEDHGEMIANLMLCYRHLEDASMRLGKAIQASDGGVSVYDRETTVGA